MKNKYCCYFVIEWDDNTTMNKMKQPSGLQVYLYNLLQSTGYMLKQKHLFCYFADHKTKMLCFWSLYWV